MSNFFRASEEFILDYSGIFIQVVGVCGTVVTFFFDRIARGIWQEFGWLQITGIIVFIAIFIFGIIVSKFLGDIKRSMENL